MGLFKDEDVLRVLYSFNPWWSNRSTEPPPFRRLAFDACCKYLNQPSIRRGVLLSGPRRVGKTTVLYQLAFWLLERFDRRSVLYLSLDHPVLKMLSIEEIVQVYNENVWPGGQAAHLLLDEVQYSKDWDLHLKILIDHRQEYRIVATGSAALKQKDATIDSGVGRWLTVAMPTLSFYEFLRIRNKELPDVSRQLRPLNLFDLEAPERRDIAQRFQAVLPEFQRYLMVGGFPETAISDDRDYCQRIVREDVVERVMKRDMVALFGVRNVHELEKLFIYLCFHTGAIFSVKTCANQIGTTTTTVTSYLQFLENANLIYRLSPAQLTGKKILRQQSKYYLVDAALRNAVLLRGEEVLSDSDEMGRVVETSVLRHLYAYYYLDTPRVTYWRESKTDKEVDVIVKSPNYVIPVEVKYRQSAKLSARDGLVKYAQLDNTVQYGYMVTKLERDFDVLTFQNVSARFLKVPAHIFIYLLGQAEHSLWEQAGRRTSGNAVE